jgi:hypothetical protein
MELLYDAIRHSSIGFEEETIFSCIQWLSRHYDLGPAIAAGAISARVLLAIILRLPISSFFRPTFVFYFLDFR